MWLLETTIAAIRSNPLEWVAALLGAISVGLVILRSVWAFPIGIVMVLLYVKIFYAAKLYSDMGLQVVFAVMQVQGWYLWAKGDKADDDLVAVRSIPLPWWGYLAVIQVVCTWLLGRLMGWLTDAVLPFLDAFATVMSIQAQWLMNKRYLENWTLWIMVDVLYLYIYSNRELYPTAVLYGLFLVMAAIGLWQWRRKLMTNDKFL
jgi:nicotinamide mononucleotide transporter